MFARRLWMVAAGIAVLLAGSAPPARAESNQTQGISVALIWTSPGDDGMAGTAAAYDIRYWTQPITESNFAEAWRCLDAPRPAVGGSLQFCIIRELKPESDYYFAIRTVDGRGNWSAISNVAVHSATLTTAVPEPARLSFAGPVPNPARGSTFFAYTLPEASFLSVVVFDVTGRLVRTLAGESRPAGAGDLVWDLADDTGRPLRAGLYLVRARIGERTFLRRVAVVR